MPQQPELGAGIFVDISKSDALQLKEPEDPTSNYYGRITRGMFSKMTGPGKKALFQVTATAAAGLNVSSASLTVDTDDADLQPWIPSLDVGRIEAVVGKSVSISSTSRRRGRAMSEVSRRRLESWIPEDAHRGLKMLRQRELLINVEEVCGVESDSGGISACATMSEIGLNLGRITTMIEPILGKLVNANDDGPFDQVAIPLLELDKRLPGVSDLAGKTITFLDIAEIYVGPKSGVDSARLLLTIYRALKKVMEQFTQGDTIQIAQTCTFVDKMECTGGLTDFLQDDGRRTLLEKAQEMESVFSTFDSSGQPISPAHRWLAEDCTATFEGPDCAGGCTGCGTSSSAAKAKCEARKLKCKGQNIEGLTFPFMNDPASLLGLLSGGDIEVFEFKPPPLTFAFDMSISTVLFTPPVVELVISFGCSVTLEYAVVFTSRGIREAIQGKSLKASGGMRTFGKGLGPYLTH